MECFEKLRRNHLLDIINIAKSERWRWQWALRTAISISCISFLALYQPTKNFLTRNGKHDAGPAFAGLVTGMAKDRMFGSTLINSWNLVMCCALSCFLCWIVVILVGETKGVNNTIPNGVQLVIIFVLVLLLQCMELAPLGKKFGASIIPLLILAINDGINPSQVWEFQVDALIGAGCALIGNLIPLPEYSDEAVRNRSEYLAHSTSSLLSDIFRAWQYQSCFDDAKKLHSAGVHARGSGGGSSGSSGGVVETSSLNVDPENIKNIENYTDSERRDGNRRDKRQEGLSLLEKSRLQALRKVTRDNEQHRHSHQRSHSCRNDHRQALSHRKATSVHSDEVYSESKAIECTERRSQQQQIQHENNKNTDTCRKQENRHWRKLRLILMATIQMKLSQGIGLGWYFSNNSSGSKFLRFELVKFLNAGISELAARNVEAKFSSLNPLRRFLFHKYDKLASLLRDTLNVVTILEEKISVMESSPELNYIYRAFHNMPAFRHALSKYVECLCHCIELTATCLTSCDKQSIHPANMYNKCIKMCVSSTADLLIKQELFENEYFKCRQLVYYDHIDENTHLYYRNDDALITSTKVPLNPDVLMNMNSFLFLSDALCTLIVQFWTPDELAQIQECVERHLRGDHVDHHSSSFVMSTRENIATVWSQCKLAFFDLFPSQLAAFEGFFPHAKHHKRQVALIRLRAAFSVAVAMTLASAYGIYMHRKPAFLAAFTIAFLAGGAAAGATLVTSLNRAAGTVVACVWAIIVQLILDNGGSGRSNSYTADHGPSLQQQLIVGFAVVLLQFPATVVRSYPLQGYAGTCASFTICVMLFPPDLYTEDSTNRIIDTFVGVVIYLAVEAMLSTAYTEGILLNSMKVVFEGVDERFHGFQKNFRLYKRRMSEHIVRSVTENLSHVHHLREMHVAPVNERIKTQNDLLRFLELEPGLSRPPPLPGSLVAECVALQAQAVRHMQVMYWAVHACMQDPMQDGGTQRHLAQYLLIASIIAGRSHAPAHISGTSPHHAVHPHTATTAVEGPTETTSRLPSAETAKSALVGLPSPVSCSRTLSHGRIHPISSEHNSVFNFAIALGPAPVVESLESVLGDPTHHTMTTPFVALPLESSFVEVGSYITQLTCFLQLCIRDLKEETPPPLWWHKSHASDNPLPHDTLQGLGLTAKRRAAAHVAFLSHFIPRDELQLIAEDADLLSKLEAQQVVALFSRFQIVLEILLKEVVDSVTTTVMVDGIQARTPRQNKEVKIVNAMIASAMDLVRALHRIAEVMSKVRAHRDIHMTQTGKKVS